MKTVFLSKFEKDLDNILDAKLREDVFEAILNVENAQNLSEINHFKKLSGYKKAYRIKVGNYRIGLFIENDRVEFARLVHRKDIYKYFP